MQHSAVVRCADVLFSSTTVKGCVIITTVTTYVWYANVILSCVLFLIICDYAIALDSVVTVNSFVTCDFF